jgi:hypothetical protein
MGAAALKSAQISEDALNFYKTIYASDLAPAQRKQQELAERVTGSYLEDAQMAREQARQRIEEDIANKPLRDRVISDAMNYDSQEEIDKKMGIAAASVNQQFSNANAQAARLSSRYGRIGGSFGQTNEALLAQASTAAGLMTGTAQATKDKAIALRAGVGETTQGRANTAGQYLGLAGNSMSGALGAGSSAMADMRANASTMGQGYGISLNGLQTAGNIYGQEFQGRMQGYQAQMGAISGLAGAAGTYYGLQAKPPVK